MKLIVASTAITAALIFYTLGVFSEYRSGKLSGKGLALFWAGLACDSTGTSLMSSMARAGASSTSFVHGITGAMAIALMLLHAVWATAVFVRSKQGKDDGAFHTFSTVVWLIWLVPYLIGLLMGIPVLHLKTVCAVGTSLLAVGALALALFGKKLPGALSHRA